MNTPSFLRTDHIHRFCGAFFLNIMIGVPALIVVGTIFLVGLVLAPINFFQSFGSAMCVVSFSVSYMISQRKDTIAGRWGGLLAFPFIWVVPLLGINIRLYPPFLYFLLTALFCTFIGGDFGDHTRKRREYETMRREHEEAEARYHQKLQSPPDPADTN